ncbi:MAG TPA: diguanylate cyclase, partial [Acidimicrobiales bacterium]|nr:diguanylate cyclase [Acidimicrobiales bacterium]
AGDGEEAVRLAGALHPDLVILDVAMPGMDGLTAIAGIRRESPASRIVVVSAMDAERVKDRALASGAEAFIEKRLLSDSLAQRLMDACRLPRRPPSAPDVNRHPVTGVCAAADDPTAADPTAADPAAHDPTAHDAPVREQAQGADGPPDQDWFSLAFDHAPIGMALLDLDGRFLKVNDGLGHIVGHGPAQLVGAGADQISHPGDADRHAALRARLLSPEPGSTEPGARAQPWYQAEQRFVRSDGNVWTLVTCSLLRAADGAPSGFLCQVLDLTERTLAEAAGARADELRERYEKKLARSNSDLAQFATVAAHDLKSPLQVIKGFASLLEQTHADVLDERGQEFLAFILKSASRMNVLIDDLLAYAKVGADRRPSVAVSLARVVDDVRTALDAELTASGGSLAYDALPVVAGDPAQFVHLLRDLVANGLKFVAEGVAPRIRISASRMINAWCIDVADNGIGVDPQHRSYVFGMFQRLHRDEYDGTGIGLAIGKRIVEQRGGSIWVEENPHGGSRFRFTVPDELGSHLLDGEPGQDLGAAPHVTDVAPAAGSRPTTSSPTPSAVPAIRAPEHRPQASGEAVVELDVLLVEDDDAHARLVEETLAGGPDGGYRLRRARDLAGARAELQRHPPDCILLDLFLPDGQGLESLRQLTTLEPLAPIVILTSMTDEQLGLQAVHEGAQDYLVKGTVDGPRLTRALRHAIERKALEARFAEQALHDPLTGLANRTLLLDRVRLELARNRRSGGGVAVFYLDVDDFKAINDRWGHAAGDEVLVRVARRLSQVVRPGDTVSRVGGDEFVVVCGGVDSEGVEQMRARIAEALGRPLLLGGGTELVTASIGVTVGHGATEEEPEAIIRRADDAMYQIKHRRRVSPDSGREQHWD